jgi:peptide/nickel transport system substrate-binding protein
LASHRYDALLHGITIGTDPDVFAYWHSSQFDVRSANRYNFSEYKSDAADNALQAGRSRVDPALRAIKYQPFLDAWQKDAPALGLYQPRYLYLTRGEVFGLKEHAVNTGVDRLANVDDWMIRTARVTQ